MAEYEINLGLFPQEHRAQIKEMREKDPVKFDAWKSDRLACLTDPLFLSEVLGFDFQEDPHRLMFDQLPKMKPLDGLSFGDLSPLIKKFMVLWSRGVFKTSSIIVLITQIILNYPNIRSCFLTGGDNLAKRQLQREKRVFEKPTQRFAYLFPEFCFKSVYDAREKKWADVPAKLGNAHEFTVPCRTMQNFAEPTFAISTAKSVKAGSHYDLILVDDLVNDQNYRSQKLLEKCYQDYLDICPLLDPAGLLVMTGTRYSFGDTYERIQEKAKEEEKELGRSIWHFSIRGCWTYGCQHCEHSSVYHNPDGSCLKCLCSGFQTNEIKGVLFPLTKTRDGRTIGWTIEFLEGERIRLGPDYFAFQYENTPLPQESQTFTEDLINSQTIFQLELVPTYSESFTFVVGDLAYVGQSDRDYSVLFFCRLNQGRIFVYDCDFGNWDSSAVAEHTASAILKHRPNALFYERFLGWEAYHTVISGHVQKVGIVNLPLQWLPTSNSPNAKLVRIGTAKAPLKSHRLWLFAGMKGYDELKRQLLRWPKSGKHDDFADCLGHVVGAPTNWQMTNPPAQVSQTNWLRKLNQVPDQSDAYEDNGCGSGLVC